MGHSAINMTLDRYGHLLPRGDDAEEIGRGRAFVVGLGSTIDCPHRFRNGPALFHATRMKHDTRKTLGFSQKNQIPNLRVAGSNPAGVTINRSPWRVVPVLSGLGRLPHLVRAH